MTELLPAAGMPPAGLPPPAAVLILGALLVPLFRGRLRQAYLLLVPVLAGLCLCLMPVGTYWRITFLGYELIFGRVDKLSMAFGTIFVVFKVTDAAIGLRVSAREELAGLDHTEHGTISYPEFGEGVVQVRPGERIMMPSPDPNP